MMNAVAYPVVVAQLSPCGLRSGDVALRFDDELQSTIVTVRRSAKVDAPNFICIRQALWAKADVQFENERLFKLYRAFDEEMSRAEARAVARAWLNQRGLLERLPTFASGETASFVTVKIEQFCGIRAGAAFEERPGGFIAIKRSFMTMPPPPAAECLLYAVAAIDFEKLGFKFGFVGNEAVAEQPKVSK